jgi:hypothetical protein
MGHPVGERCLCPRAAFGDDFVVIDSLGIHPVAVDYCDCEAALPPPQQLLRHRWFPSTALQPRSAATFAVLEHFHILNFESKVSVFEFYHSIARASDNTAIQPPKVSYLLV